MFKKSFSEKKKDFYRPLSKILSKQNMFETCFEFCLIFFNNYPLYKSDFH